MKADRIARWEAAEVGAPLRRVCAPVPQPGPGEVRLAMHACGLNFADTLMLEGRYQEKPPWPLVPGMEVAGVVEACGAGVTRPVAGDRVACFVGHGGLAEALCVPARSCVALPGGPNGLDPCIAAAFQVAHGTAHLALHHRARLRHGERLVVTGAAGGTGLAAVQIGRLLGADVVAVARGPEKRQIAREAGARHSLDADATDLREQILALGGADVVVDTVGAPLWDTIARAANPEARLLPIGFAGGKLPEIRANHLMVKNHTVIGVNWSGYARFAPEIAAQSLAAVFGWIVSGALVPRIGARIPFEEADRALDLIRQRRATGKIVVTRPAGADHAASGTSAR